MSTEIRSRCRKGRNMKILLYASIVAFILDHFGTIHATPIAQRTPDKQVELFRKYALGLVSAVVKPLRTSKILLEGACQCLSGLDVGQNADVLDLTLATMSIARDYHGDLERMRKSPDNSAIIAKRGLMENIRLILVVLQGTTIIPPRNPGAGPWDKYLFKPQNSSDTASALLCYRSLLTMDHGINKTFFAELMAGATIANILMRYEDEDAENNPTSAETRAVLATLTNQASSSGVAAALTIGADGRNPVNDRIISAMRVQLDKVIGNLPTYELDIPGADFEKDALELLRTLFRLRNAR